MTYSNWKWILDRNPDLLDMKQPDWRNSLKPGEHILWACANPSCLDENGKRTVFDRGTNMRGSEFCPKCVEAIKSGDGRAIDPDIQAAVDAMESESDTNDRSLGEDGVQATHELYRWHRERINPTLASRYIDLFKE